MVLLLNVRSHDHQMSEGSSDSDNRRTKVTVTMTKAANQSNLNEEGSDDDLDALVSSNLLHSTQLTPGKRPKDEENEWKKVESRRSPLSSVELNHSPNDMEHSTSILDSEVFTRDIESKPFTGQQQKQHRYLKKPRHSTPLKSQDENSVEDAELQAMRESMVGSKPVAIEKHLVETQVIVASPSESDDTILADRSGATTPVQEVVGNPATSQRKDQIDDVMDNLNALEYAQSHEVPLPSFGVDDTGSEAGGRSEIDLDDISRQDSDIENDLPEEPVVTLDGNINFGNNWIMNSSLFKDKNIISAYDNFGEKKVGKDSTGPTLMLVPQTEELPLAKIGDL